MLLTMGLAFTSPGQDQVLLSQTCQRQALGHDQVLRSQTRQRQTLGRKPRGNTVWTNYTPKIIWKQIRKGASICDCIEDQNMDYYREGKDN